MRFDQSASTFELVGGWGWSGNVFVKDILETAAYLADRFVQNVCGRLNELKVNMRFPVGTFKTY